MDNEIDILADIYADVINHIEYIKTSRKRMMNIKNNIQFVDNNYFEIICNDELLKRYLNVFDNVKECNELVCDLHRLKDSVKDKIKDKCEHDWVNDTIDINPDSSKNICYCVKCEITKK
jgi:hypothetical protein